MRRCRSLLALSSFGLIFVACGDGDGGENGGLSFAGMCDQGSTLMCKKASECGSTTPQAECIAESKAMFCAGGEEQFCGVGLTVQASKVAACLDTLETLTCLQLSERPTACTAEVLCGSSSGSPPTAAQGEACQARESSFECNPKASICYAAGTVSSCPSGGLCLGDSNGMNCAARCTVDEDCLTTGTGLVCLQNCTTLILNGFCLTPKAKSKFMGSQCTDPDRASTTGTAGWAL